MAKHTQKSMKVTVVAPSPMLAAALLTILGAAVVPLAIALVAMGFNSANDLAIWDSGSTWMKLARVAMNVLFFALFIAASFGIWIALGRSAHTLLIARSRLARGVTSCLSAAAGTIAYHAAVFWGSVEFLAVGPLQYVAGFVFLSVSTCGIFAVAPWSRSLAQNTEGGVRFLLSCLTTDSAWDLHIARSDLWRLFRSEYSTSQALFEQCMEDISKRHDLSAFNDGDMIHLLKKPSNRPAA